MLIYAVTVQFVLVVLVLLDGGASVGSCSNRRPNAGEGLASSYSDGADSLAHSRVTYGATMRMERSPFIDLDSGRGI
jgi:hypothetical protein